MKIYSNCVNALIKYFLPPFHGDLSYIYRKVVVKLTPNYCPYNILPPMQHFCDTVQLPVSVVILKLLHQNQYTWCAYKITRLNFFFHFPVNLATASGVWYWLVLSPPFMVTISRSQFGSSLCLKWIVFLFSVGTM